MDETIVLLEDFRHAGDSDYSAAFLRIRDETCERGYGCNIQFPSGEIEVSEPVKYDFSSGTLYESMSGINLTGTGSTNCVLLWTGDDEPMFQVTSSKINAGPILDLHWKGFMARPRTRRNGSFLYSQYLGVSKFEDVRTFYFDQHYEMADSLVVNFDKCQSSWGRRGFFAHRADFTCPNAISFTNASGLGGFDEWAAVITNGSEFIIDGGSTVENNGRSTDPNLTDKGGIKLNAPGNEGGVGASINRCYFEGNQGKADVLILANASFQTSVSFTDNVFNKKTGAAPNHIRVETDVGYRGVEVYHWGNNFTHFPDYTPDPSHKHMIAAGNGPVSFHGHSRFWSNMEAPSFPNDMPHAAVIFNGTTLAQGLTNNVYTITRHGAGQYSIIFRFPSRGTHFVEAVTNGVHLHHIYSEDTGQVRVHFLNMAGVSVDPDSVRIRVFS